MPVIKQLADRVEFHRLRSGNPESGPLFRNALGGPVCLNNVLRRQILPALKRCENCGKAEADHAQSTHEFRIDENFPKRRGWHAARRGLGTNLYALGVPEKVIQLILRHANVSTTSTCYIKTLPAQVTDAIGRLEQALPESLSDNKVATQNWNAAASPAVN